MQTSVKHYFLDGCGRCEFGGTQYCKVHNWTTELQVLRNIALSCELNETCKWGVPCYTYQTKNILILSAFKNCCSISFFKGVLLKDEKGLLEKPGKNSQSDRRISFTSVDQIEKATIDIKNFIHQAIEIEKNHTKVNYSTKPDPIPDELETYFNTDEKLRNAFQSLTPGKQRGYTIYISQAKQVKTRINRIEKCIPMILNGIGIHDKYTKR